MILAGQLLPGHWLKERETGDLLGVSRSSVREALRILAEKQLVELIDNVGARVRVVTVAEAIERYEVREVLEGLCARKAAENVTKSKAEQLLAIGTSMKEAVQNEDWQQYSQLNTRLHALVREFAGHSTAQEQLEGMHMELIRQRFPLAPRPGRPAESLPQHLAIIDAVVKGNPVASEEAARAHVRDVIRVLSETTEEPEDS